MEDLGSTSPDEIALLEKINIVK